MSEAGLEALQAFMAEAIRSERPLTEDAALALRAAQVAAGSERLSPVAQVDVYREQFWLRHQGSLEEDYPTLVHLLGGEAFSALCRVYLREHPPASFSLRDLAADMPSFLAKTAPYRDDGLLADCARVEWAFIEAFDAADAPPLDPSVLATTDEDAWPGARLMFHPSLQLLSLAYPAHEFRAAVRRGEAPARPEAHATAVAIFRAGERLTCTVVQPVPFELLVRLSKGEALGAACEAVAAMEGAGDLESEIAGWFQAWVGAGWLTRVEV